MSNLSPENINDLSPRYDQPTSSPASALDVAEPEVGIEEDDDDLFEGIYNDRPLTSQEAASVSSQGNAEGSADELYEHYRAVADPGQQLLRVDKFLINLMHDTSRNRIQAAADAGCIHVNGRAVKRNYP